MNRPHSLPRKTHLAALLAAGLGLGACDRDAPAPAAAPTAEHRPAASASAPAAHDHGAHAPAQPVQKVKTPTTRIEVEAAPEKPVAGKPATLTLKVLGEKTGKPVERFQVVHDKLMHLLVVSRDFSTFLHIHPEHKGGGVFEVKTTLPRAGTYRLYADYTPEGDTQEIAQKDLEVEGKDPLPPRASLSPDKLEGGWLKARAKAHDEGKPAEKTASEYEVALMPMPGKLVAGKEAMLHFQVRGADGLPIKDLEPYLGAMGHAVILSEDGSRFLHSHPMEGGAHGAHGAHGEHAAHGERAGAAPTKGGPDVMFHTTFPAPGLYKAWGQFKHKDKIITSSFVVDVAPGEGGAHGAGEHAHGSPHGGVVQTAGDGHVEVLLGEGGEVRAWLLDSAEKPRSGKGAKLAIRPVLPGAKEIPLSYDEKEDVFRGKLEPAPAGPLEVLVSVTPAGASAPATARLALPAR